MRGAACGGQLVVSITTVRFNCLVYHCLLATRVAIDLLLSAVGLSVLHASPGWLVALLRWGKSQSAISGTVVYLPLGCGVRWCFLQGCLRLLVFTTMLYMCTHCTPDVQHAVVYTQHTALMYHVVCQCSGMHTAHCTDVLCGVSMQWYAHITLHWCARCVQCSSVHNAVVYTNTLHWCVQCVQCNSVYITHCIDVPCDVLNALVTS